MTIEKIWKEIKQLNRAELLHLLCSYDEYVRQVQEENGGEAICVAEFYTNDYQDYFKQQKYNGE